MKSRGIEPAAMHPVDRVASRVAKGQGEGYTYKGTPAPGLIESDKPLPVRPFAGPRHLDLKGKRIRGVRVIGCWDDGTRTVAERRTVGGHRKHETKWVVRCVCSKYMVKKRAVLREGKQDLMCRECVHVQALARQKQPDPVSLRKRQGEQ